MITDDERFIEIQRILAFSDYVDNSNNELEQLQQENKQLKDRINKAIEILHNINEDLPLDLILTEIEHTEYVLKGDKE